MTIDQLIYQLFTEHWLITTICFPEVTFLYAWITDQTAWLFGSLVLIITEVGWTRHRYNQNK
jgi:hypothetical protein